MSFRVIQTTEQLKDYIHSIHDFIRNSGAGYGMSALKIFNVFYSLKIIKGKCEYFGIKKDLFDWKWLGEGNNCNDESMRDIVNRLRDYNNTQTNTHFVRLDTENGKLNTLFENFEKYINPNQLGNLKNQLKIINDDFEEYMDSHTFSENTKNMAFYIYHQIPINKEGEFYQTIYRLIDDIPSQVIGLDEKPAEESKSLDNVVNKFDIKGKVYEYFIGRDKTAISELGAYFTDRYITNFTFEFIDLELDVNGRVPSMIDPFGGSGGFTIQYTKNINDKFEINWSDKDNYKQVHHFDMAEDVVKVAGVEYFSITEHFPIKDIQFKNTNTFTHPFNRKFQVVVSNPPYGGDKNKKSVDKDKNIMIIKLNKELINKIETLLKNMASNISTPKSKSKGKSKIGYDFEYKQLINEICELNNEDSFIQDVINHYSTFCAKYDININDIEPFKQCFVRESNSKNNFEFEVEINDSNDLFVFLAIMHRQIIELNEENENEDEEQSDKKVNLRTCSDFITNYAVEIVNNDDITSRKLIIDAINKELLVQTDKSKLLNLNKSLKYYKSKPIKYVLDDKFKDSYFKDKEACSLILLMNLVEDNGICVGLLKEGVFFNPKYSLLRGFLIHNFNVTDIVSVPNKAFENTTTKTSMVVFRKNGSTTNINFWELDVEKSKNIFIKYNKLIGNKVQFLKEQILSVDKKFLCKASFKQLCKIKTTYNKNNDPSFELDYSLDYKDYMDYQVVCPSGFELKPLGEICEINYGKRITKQNNTVGDIPVYGGGDITFYTNKPNRHGTNTVVSRFGISKSCVRIVTGDIYLNDGAMSLHNKNKWIEYYIGIYLYNNQDIVYGCANGSCQKGIDVDIFKKLKIPIPLDINTLQPQLESLYDLHLQISNMTQSIPDKEKQICGLIKRLTDEGKKGVDYDEYTFDKLCEIKSGKAISKSDRTGTKYKYITANGFEGYVDTYLFDGKYVILAQDGSIGATHLLNEKFYPSNHVWILNTRLGNVTNEYIYIYMKYIFDYDKISHGSILGKITREKIETSIIRVLKPHIMAQHNMQQLFDEVDNLKTVLETSQQEYKKQMNELFKDFTDEYIVTSSNNTNDEGDDEDQTSSLDSSISLNSSSINVNMEDDIIGGGPPKIDPDAPITRTQARKNKKSKQAVVQPETVPETVVVQPEVQPIANPIVEAPKKKKVKKTVQEDIVNQPIVITEPEPIVETPKKKKKKAIVVEEVLTQIETVPTVVTPIQAEEVPTTILKKKRVKAKTLE